MCPGIRFPVIVIIMESRALVFMPHQLTDFVDVDFTGVYQCADVGLADFVHGLHRGHHQCQTISGRPSPPAGPRLETERNPQAGGITVFIEVVPCLLFDQGLLVRHEHLASVWSDTTDRVPFRAARRDNGKE